MKKLIEGSIKRRVTVAMFTIAILLFGFVSFSRLTLNLLPDLTYPSLTIRSEYPGAAPAEIENLIAKPIEESVGVVKNVREVSSVSRSGQADVVLEFAWGTDMDMAIMEVREKIDSLELPLDVKRPVILRFDPSLDPIIRFALYGGQAAEAQDKTGSAPETGDILKQLRRTADEQIKKTLESTPGVAAIKIGGGLEDEVQILADQSKLARLNISIDALAELLGAENVNLSGGRLEEGGRQFLVRTLNRFQTVREMEDVIVMHKDGGNIYLRDIAEVRGGSRERTSVTRMKGREAVEIAIYKEGDANTVAAASAVDSQIALLKKELPKGMELIKIYDQSSFIRQAVDEVINAGILGGILAIFVLYFFLRDFWTTFIISLSIPVSVIATFNIMHGYGLSLNIMSLGGIALGIGMLVDNSIVVLENISRHRSLGKDSKSAALEGAKEVSTAVTASTLTTVAVFFPLVFVQGVAGQLFRDQALTITFSLLISLVVALTLIPMLASRSIAPVTESGPENAASAPRTAPGRLLRRIGGFFLYSVPVFFILLIKKSARLLSRLALFLLTPLLNIFTGLYNRVEVFYPRFLEKALKRKGLTLGTALVVFLLSAALIPFLGVELIPQLSQGEFRVEFQLEPGAPLEKTDELLAAVQTAADRVQGVGLTFAVAGSGNRFSANPEQGGDNWGELSVAMQRGAGLEQESAAMEAIRGQIHNTPGLQYKFYRPMLFSFKTPVEVEIAGYDPEQLKAMSGKLAERMAANNRFSDVKSSMEAGHPEIRIIFDRERAAALGLNVHQAAQSVVKKVRGHVATRFSRDDRKIDVLVRSREEERASIEDIGQILVDAPGKKAVPLRAVAEIQTGVGPSEIRRSEQERVALVTANLTRGGLGDAAADIAALIEGLQLPENLSARIAGQNEEMRVSFNSLRLALLLAIFLVYLVLASQFESFIHPLIVILSIPLALAGVTPALFITGSNISVVVFIGVILLAGIVVNNAIVLIDRVNQLRESGMAKEQAVMEAGHSRLRPIMMTTLTTVLGLIPLAIGLGEGAEVRAPMAITVIGGLSVSTLLTLVVIPVAYCVMDRKK